MVERIVLIKLHDDYANDADRKVVVEQAHKLLPGVPGVRSVWVGTPADAKSESSWDISIVVTFDSIDDVDAYVPHPEHRSYVEQVLEPRCTFKKAWNFERHDKSE